VGDREAELLKLKMSPPFQCPSIHQYKSTENGQRRKRGVTPTFRLLSRRDLPRFPIGPTHPQHRYRELVKVTQALTLLEIHPIPQAQTPHEDQTNLISPLPNNIHQRWGGLKSCLVPI